MNKTDGLITEKEAAEYLGIHVMSLRISRQDGQPKGRIFVPYVKLGRAVRYDMATLRQWIAEHTITTKES